MWIIESSTAEHGGPAKQTLDERSVFNNPIVTIIGRRRGTKTVRIGPCERVIVGTDHDDKAVKLLDSTCTNTPRALTPRARDVAPKTSKGQVYDLDFVV